MKEIITLDITLIILAALVGAFFTYLSGRMADRYREINSNYKNLKFLELLLNFHLNINAGNIESCRSLSQTLRVGALSTCIMHLYTSRIEDISNILDEDYRIRLAMHWYELDYFNHDINTYMSRNSEIKLAYLQGNISRDNYGEEAIIFAEEIESFKDRLIELDLKILSIIDINKHYIINNQYKIGKIYHKIREYFIKRLNSISAKTRRDPGNNSDQNK